MRIKLFTILFLALAPLAHASITSYDHTFVSNDVYSADFPKRLNENFTKSLTGGINHVTTTQITDDTLLEADMADEINPRIRTAEGASCEFVYTGLLPVTDSDLTSDISAGTAYPDGYRVRKASATSKTYTASRWTFVDIDINGDFQYTEVSIDAATPAVAANSVRLARVSTDGTTIVSVQDLRTTSCTAGPFTSISNESTGASLGALLTNGSPIKRQGTGGFLQGLHISRDASTTFIIYPGCAYINGEFRCNTSNTTVPQTADNPSVGTSGIDTGAIAAGTRYNVFAVADQDAVSTMSVSYSTSSAPTGVTNARKLGEIKTDASSSFISSDIVQVNNLDNKELVKGWVRFSGDGLTPITSKYNVSGIVDDATGTWTVTWDTDLPDGNYAFVGTCGGDTDLPNFYTDATAPTGASIQVLCVDTASNSNVDVPIVNVFAWGE